MAKRMFPVWSVVAALAMLLGGFSFVPGTPAAHAGTESESSADESTSRDQLILKSGRVVECEILNETPSSLEVLVWVGSISAKATYDRSQILEIKRDAVPVEGAARESEKAEEAEEPASASAEDAAAKLYVIELEGEFGVEVSQTPLREAFEEVDEYFGDVRDGEVMPEFRDRHIVVLKMNTETDPRRGFDGIWRAEDIAPVVEDQLTHKKRRVVFWIEKANGGASFLPWISPEIYFTSDGEMGGVGNLDEFDLGDDMVNEKQISLRIGHAEGFAIKGGYFEIGPPIIRAMAREQNWLCVRWEGGRPIFLESEPPADDEYIWTVLTDSGEGEYEDEFEFKGNDRLTIDSDLALKLNLARGIADDYDELAFRLDLGRDYAVIDGEDADAQDELERWADDIKAAIDDVNQRDGRLWEEFNRIEVEGDYNDRKRARGKQLQILKQIRSIYTRFEEVLDPDESARAQIDVMIANIRQEMELDRANRRRG